MFKIVICDDNLVILDRTTRVIDNILKVNNIHGEIVCKAFSLNFYSNFMKTGILYNYTLMYKANLNVDLKLFIYISARSK